MASLNPFRRRNQPALLASGESVNIASDSAVQAVLKRREEWQKQAGEAFDACGEIHNGVTQLADLMSRLVVFPAKKPSSKDAQPERDDDEVAKKTADRLGSIVDVSQLLYDMTMHLVLIGETELLGVQPRPEFDLPTETWMAYSHMEIEKSEYIADDGSIKRSVSIPDFFEGQPLILDPDRGDTWIRVWRPHPLRKSRADSHVRPLLGAVDELVWWDHAAESAAKNRLILNGAVGVPTNLELPREANEPANLSGASRFMRRLYNTAIKTLRNPGSASSALPIFYTYPWNESGKSGLDVTVFERQQDELLELRSDRSLRRIAQGFPLPVESFFGFGNASQFGSREISETKFRENVEPFALFLFSALTRSWYQSILRDSGVEDWRDRLLWYDTSNLVVHPDITQGADKGFEYGNISGEAWRRVRGFRESDKPKDAEKVEMLEWLRGLRGRDEKPKADDADRSPDEPTDQTPHGTHAPVEKDGAPVRGKGQPVLASTNGHTHTHANLGRRLAEIDADLLSRVQVMTDSAMRRALEKAGNKLKNRANKNVKLKQALRGVAAEEVAMSLGREAVIALGMDDLFSDCFENVPRLFINWMDKASEAAFVAAGLTPDKRKDAAYQLACGTDEASAILVRDLREHAATLLFDQATSKIPQPEADDLLVPASIVRKAIAVAGGTPQGTKSALLLATGPAMTRSLADVGHFVSEYTFWYAPKPRAPYLAHQRLDGTVVQLEGGATIPGDVEFCSCLVVPVFEGSE